MKFKLLLIFFVFDCFSGFSQSTSHYHRVEIPLGKVSLKSLSELGIEVDHGSKISGNKYATDLSEAEINVLKLNDIPYEITIHDVSKYYRTRQSSGNPSNRDATVCFPDKPITPPANFKLGSMGGYYTYQEYLDELDEMMAKYPNLISSYKPIGNFITNDGNTLNWLKISNNPELEESEPEVLYTAVHHAREPQGLSQLIYFMWYLLENYATDPEIKALVDNTELYFVPVINPDGYLYNEFTDPQGGGMWRKNRINNPDNSKGVDLNRNYATFWGFDDSGSSPDPKSDVYRGSAPFSEIETKAIRQFCNTHNFKFALNYHSFGNLVIYPWGNDGSNCPDSTSFQLLADRMVDYNKFTAGTSIETVGYYVNGGSDDWMYGDQTQKAAIISFTPEVGEFYDGFWPFQDRIIPLSEACLEMNLQVLRSTHNNIGLSYKGIPAMSGKDNIFTLDAIQTGISPLNTAIQISEPTGKMIFLNPEKSITMGTSSTQKIPFDVIWGDVKNGDQITVYFNWSDGFTSHQDSVDISFHDVKEVVFTDGFSNLDNWDATGLWGITNKQFYSGGSCVTDSPEGPYLENSFSYISMKQGLNNNNQYDKLYLRYHGKWSIERNFDYVAVVLKDIPQNTENYLCGFNMTKGTLEQAGENSVYESNSLKWEEEVIDITEFKETNFRLIFEIGSDGGDERDGFYLDDLEIVGFREKTTQSSTYAEKQIKIYPNPAQSNITVTGTEAFDEMYFTDMLGNQMANYGLGQISGNTISLPTDLPNGVYLVSFKKQNKLVSMQKLIVIK